METQSCLVIPVGEEKEMKVYLSTQHPTFTQVCYYDQLHIEMIMSLCYD